MTDRINGIFVSLDKDYREDDVQTIVNTINMIKGVSHCSLNVVNVQDYLSRDRVRQEVGQKLISIIHETLYGGK